MRKETILRNRIEQLFLLMAMGKVSKRIAADEIIKLIKEDKYDLS